MREKFVFWLPGAAKSVQMQRLRTILAPVCDHLRQQGLGAECLALRNDAFGQGAGAVNIWLACEYLDAPPMAGTHVLWFLNQMKIAPQSVLLAYDAVLTASADHARFLQGWIGDLRPVQWLSWPIGALGRPAPDDRSALGTLSIAYTRPMAQGGAVFSGTLPGRAEDLAQLFARHGQIVSLLPVRERACGFYSYDEAVAVLAGRRVYSAPRQGLPSAISAAFVPQGAQIGDALPPLPDAAARQAFHAAHDPGAVAAALARLRDLPPWPRAVKPAQAAPAFGRAAAAPPAGEAQAFFRDYDRAMAALNLLPPLAAAGTRIDLAQPWPGALGLEGTDQGAQAELPWTDLTRIVQKLAQYHGRAAQMPPQDIRWLLALRKVLRRYVPGLGVGAQAPADLPARPWAQVAAQSTALRRDHLALSRAVNGHNLYRFSHAAAAASPPKAPLLPAGYAAPHSMLAQSGIFLHGYYLDSAVQILGQLHPHLGQCPLFLATDSADKQAQLTAQLRHLGWAKARVDLVANQGRDIFAKLVHFAPDHRDFQFVLHLHTKKSPHSRSLANWGQQMIQALAGDGQKLGQIAQGFDLDAQLGMIYADPPKALYPALSWTRNLRLAEALAAQLGLPHLPASDELDFPVGSMFWARRAALDPLLNAGLTRQHFAPEQGQEDGTLAHACERLLGAIARAQGYHLARSRAD